MPEFSLFQYVVFGLALVLIVFRFVNFKSLFSMFDKKDKVITGGDSNLPSVSEIVAQWEALRAMCERKSLDSAVKELDDVFPTFIKKVNNESK